MSRVHYPTVTTLRLVRSATRNILGYLGLAFAITVCGLRASAAYPRFGARVCLVADLLAVVALNGTATRLKHSRVRRLVRYIEVLAL
jgi:hypothetical protein